MTPPTGRRVPPLPTHTFSNGETIQIRPIGPHTLMLIQQQVEKDLAGERPDVPLVETSLGPERNEADPSYRAALNTWRARVTNEAGRRMLNVAALEAIVDLDDPGVQDAVRRIRRMLRVGEVDSDDETLTQAEEDQRLYILHHCIQTATDYAAFSAAFMRQNQPTEEDVSRHVDMFPGDVQRQAGDVVSEPAPVGGNL